MLVSEHGGIRLHDYEPRQDFAADVLAGLSRPPGSRSIPSKYLYDRRGSELFERICKLPEYYPTRTEIGILRERLPEMAALLGPRCAIIEPGAGSGIKTHLLLEALDDPVAYVPVDISRELLIATARRLAADFPALEVVPLCADYLGEWEVPELARPAERRAAFFPGSTIGNMEPEEGAAMLRRLARACGPAGAILIGVDLRKDPAVIAPAYNDAAGVTAAFNLNLVARLNRELGAAIPDGAFRHVTFYNEQAGRNESYLEVTGNEPLELFVGTRPAASDVGTGPARMHFILQPDERIRVEHSYKYDLPGFAALAAGAGLRVERVWTDERGWFSVQYLVPA